MGTMAVVIFLVDKVLDRFKFFLFVFAHFVQCSMNQVHNEYLKESENNVYIKLVLIPP